MTTPPPKRTILIGTYAIDATLRETHTFESDVTMYPVESGSPISDNVRPKPITVEIDYVVSDTPLPPMDATRANDGSGDRPSVNALAILMAIRDARQPISITTAVQSYDNMILQNLVVPRDATTGEALGFTASFVQITIVRNQRTTVRTAQPQHQAKKTFTAAAVTINVVGIYVVTVPTAGATAVVLGTYESQFGPPILEDSIGFHYKVDAHVVTPDGYIGSDNKYHQLTDIQIAVGSLSDEFGGGGFKSVSAGTATGASYDPSTGTWVNSSGKPVTADPPANIDKISFPH